MSRGERESTWPA